MRAVESDAVEEGSAVEALAKLGEFRPRPRRVREADAHGGLEGHRTMLGGIDPEHRITFRLGKNLRQDLPRLVAFQGRLILEGQLPVPVEKQGVAHHGVEAGQDVPGPGHALEDRAQAEAGKPVADEG
ncbi:hypothetical protein D3C86_1095850 [compost metagenome]